MRRPFISTSAVRGVLLAAFVIFGQWEYVTGEPVTVISDEAHFVRITGAVAVSIPASSVAFPGRTCGAPSDMTGLGSSIVLPFAANRIVVTHDSGGDLCLFDRGAIITPPGNTDPNVMVANTIVGNGEDDLRLTFDRPVRAIGLRLLTNRGARETITLRDSSGAVIETVDIGPLTPPNTRVFIGLLSPTAIASLTLDTVGGATQNEGIEGVLVSETGLGNGGRFVARVACPSTTAREDVMAVTATFTNETGELHAVTRTLLLMHAGGTALTGPAVARASGLPIDVPAGGSTSAIRFSVVLPARARPGNILTLGFGFLGQVGSRPKRTMLARASCLVEVVR